MGEQNRANANGPGFIPPLLSQSISFVPVLVSSGCQRVETVRPSRRVAANQRIQKFLIQTPRPNVTLMSSERTASAMRERISATCNEARTLLVRQK